MDQDISGLVAPLGTRITSWTNCVKVRALVVAVRPAGNTAQRSIRGNAQSCKTTLTVPSAISGREHPFGNDRDTCIGEYSRTHSLGSTDAQATL